MMRRVVHILPCSLLLPELLFPLPDMHIVEQLLPLPGPTAGVSDSSEQCAHRDAHCCSGIITRDGIISTFRS